MEVVTNENIISLGAFAKDLFAEHVLVIDENGKSFDVVQTVKEDTVDRIKNIPLKGGFTQSIKDGTILAFEKMKIGEKFLCLDAWLFDYQCPEARFYWRVQKSINNGLTLQEATDEGNIWVKDYTRLYNKFNKEFKEITKANDDSFVLSALIYKKKAAFKKYLEFLNKDISVDSIKTYYMQTNDDGATWSFSKEKTDFPIYVWVN
jgi:hypothetical protein